MIFDSQIEYEELISEVAKSLKTVKKPKKKKSEMDDTSQDDPVGGEIPLDEVLPPAHGHITGSDVRTPNTTKGQTYYGGPWVEGIEDRLCRLLSEVEAAADQTNNAQKDVRQGKVGVTGVLGHSKGDKEPRTAAAAHRQEVDPYATRGKAVRKTKSAKKDKEKTPEEELKNALGELEGPVETPPAPSV